MSVIEPLPAVLNLEFERKRAKTLLRQLRASDPVAIARHNAHTRQRTSAGDPAFRLADAQRTIAREYGFSSWPLLVRYFGVAKRQWHRLHGPTIPVQFCHQQVRALISAHSGRRSLAGRRLAEYIPRFVGLPIDEVLSASITEEDAQLTVAREAGFPTWQALLAYASRSMSSDFADGWNVGTRERVVRALRAGDCAVLQALVRDHPELLNPPDHETARNGGLLNMVLGEEQRRGVTAMQPIIAWLTTQGFDFVRRRNEQLCGSQFLRPDDVRWLLSRGADPNWMPPNGIPVLEHALLRYWNGTSVDLIAAHVVPRDAFWISAGLGDVTGVSRFLDRSGRPTAAARARRPDFVAIGKFGPMSFTDATDEEILLEAMLVAALNGRTQVIEYLISRGAPIDSVALGGVPLVQLAAGNWWEAVLECLVRCGADVDLAGVVNGSARDLAQKGLRSQPDHPTARRVAALCGIDVPAFLASRNAAPVVEPVITEEITLAIALASDDARRLSHTAVSEDSLLFGFLRASPRAQSWFTRYSAMDFIAFRAAVLDRVQVGAAVTDDPLLPLCAEVTSTLARARQVAMERRHDQVNFPHLLFALLERRGRAAALLAQYGGEVDSIVRALENQLSYRNAT
jgi:hypothetical protein